VDVERVAVGAGSGAAATVAMTGWLLGGQALGQAGSGHGELPPKRLVRRLAERTGRPAERLGRGTTAASAAAHLTFGAGCGGLYAALTRRSSAPRGTLFGIGVWAASYVGWIPALRLMPPPHRDRPARAWNTATAHVVYGSLLGWLLARYDRSRPG
jgi:hypothetical protein